MKIQIGFSKTNSIVSKLIRTFLSSSISHVYVRLYDPFLGVEFIFHADLSVGVGTQLADQFDKHNETLYLFEIDDSKLDSAIRHNLRLLGRKYDKLELFNIKRTVAFRRWWKKKKVKPFEDPKKLICVDLPVKILNEAKITDLPNCELNPLSFLDWCLDNYEKLSWRLIKTEKEVENGDRSKSNL